MERPLAQQVLDELDPTFETEMTQGAAPADTDHDGHHDKIMEQADKMAKYMEQASACGDKIMEMANDDDYIDETEAEIIENMKGFMESCDKTVGVMEKMSKRKKK